MPSSSSCAVNGDDPRGPSSRVVRRRSRGRDGDGDGTDDHDGSDAAAPFFSSYPSDPLPSKKDLLSRYNDALDRRPLLTKMVTSAAVSAFGAALGSYLSSSDDAASRKTRLRSGIARDTASQRHPARMNWINVASYALHGGLVNAPLSHYWFEFLSSRGPSSRTASVLADQLVVQPPLLVLMFVCLDVFRKALGEVSPAFSRALSASPSAIAASWRFWPFAVYGTFRYLKKKHYTIALNLCSVAWTVYLSRRR